MQGDGRRGIVGPGVEIHLHAPREEHDRLLTGCVRGIADDLHGDPRLRALFFGRYNKPDWHLRVGLLGDATGIEALVREEVALRLDRRVRWTTAPYDPDVGRFGGEEGARLAERVFHDDTRACLDVLRAESDGLTRRSRREWCLVVTERYLEMLGLTRAERIEFYRYSWSFETKLGRWQADDLSALESRYAALEDDLVDLFRGEARADAARLWGGDVPARIATTYLRALERPLHEMRDGATAGRIAAHPVDLAWGLAHMHCNRMQVEADAEAIIRYFMGRLHEEVDLTDPS